MSTFPIEYCVKTEWLDFNSYCLLLTKLVTEGYNVPFKSDRSNMFDLWVYIGCNDKGDVILFDNNKDYLSLDKVDTECNNVLSQDWLIKYLGE